MKLIDLRWNIKNYTLVICCDDTCETLEELHNFDEWICSPYLRCDVVSIGLHSDFCMVYIKKEVTTIDY